MAGAAIGVVLLLVFGAVSAIVIVPKDFAYVVERLGRYHETLSVGFHVIMPIADRIKFKHSLAAQTEELSDVCETKDQYRASLTGAFRFRVLDAQRASYGAARYVDFLRELVRTAQKRYVEAQTWDSLREDRRSLTREVLRYVQAPAETVGVIVLEYDLQNLEPKL